METELSTAKIAERFVELVLRPTGWTDPDLSEEEVEILESLLQTAGFDSPCVVRGQISWPYRSEEGDESGEVCILNPACPYKAVNHPEGSDHSSATEWLNRAVEDVIRESEQLSATRSEVVRLVKQKIKDHQTCDGSEGFEIFMVND